MTIAKGGGGKKQDKPKPVESEQTVDYVEKNPEGISSKFFGIKSYIHQFYEKSAGSPVDGEAFYLLSNSPQKRVVYTCRAALIIGMGLLIVGAIAIIVAHLWPRPIPLGPQDYYDREFLPNGLESLTIWKMVGLIIFAFGGLVIAISLLIPLCCRMKWEQATAYDQIGEPIKVYPSILQQGPFPAQGDYGTKGATAGQIPVMEELKRVQPGQNDKVRKTSDDEDLLMGDGQP